MNPFPPRPSTACLRHPQEHFTSFCPLCLCERLSTLDSSSSSSSKKPPTAAAALKSIFRPSNSSFLPELRRSKSFSVSKNEGFSGVFEPQRKSCDVRARSSLCSLFTHDDARNPVNREASNVGGAEISVETENLELSSKEEEAGSEEDDAGIRVCEERNLTDEIVEEQEEPESVQEEFKTMKDHIDLDSQTKKPAGRDLKEIAGSFWSAASVFSKKLQKWREKQKVKKQRNRSGSTTLPVEKSIGRHFRETQSEIADYGFGRRSCDTDPRFSLDAGRMSFDDPRYSFDEPRASWDGYLISRTIPKMPTMLSVVEDAPVNASRSDTQIPVEESANSSNEEDNVPGGSSQTRDYYSDSSSRRRKSLDRSSSIRKTAAAVVAEMDEMKSVPNAAIVSPARETNSLRDDCSVTIDSAGIRKESKKSRRWGKGWNIWGLMNWRGGNKDEEEDRPNGVERSYSGSWPELRGGKGGLNPKMLRSNSSVSWRNSNMMGGWRRSSAETNERGKKKKEEVVLERNRSARYSPTNVENGLLRFYLTPMRGSRRGGSGKVKASQAQSIARSVLRLY